PPAPTTVMQETLRREDLTGPISPAVLRLTFPTGNVEVPAGTSLLLGRDPAESLVAAAFSGFENVSRRHATVTMDDAGHASIRDENSTNGTFVNGDRVLPGIAVRLADGDLVRLAGDVTAEGLLPRRGPEPSPPSRAGGPAPPGPGRSAETTSGLAGHPETRLAPQNSPRTSESAGKPGLHPVGPGKPGPVRLAPPHEGH